MSGEIDIPRFHCPRCRDHWYGITSEPCDEELARLIREGLWHTGKEGKHSNTSNKMKQFALKASKNGGRDFSGAGGPGGNHPSINHGSFSLQKGGSANNSSWAMRRKEDEKNKKKKRITFQLDGEENGSRGGSVSSLLGGREEGGGVAKGRRGVLEGSGEFDGRGGGGGGGGGVMGGDGGGKGIGGSGEGGVGGGADGEGSEEDADGARRRRGGARGGGGASGEGEGDGGENGNDLEGGRRGRQKNSSSKVGENGDLSLGGGGLGSGGLLSQGRPGGEKDSQGYGQSGANQGASSASGAVSSGGGGGGYDWRGEGEEEGEGEGCGGTSSGRGGTEAASGRQNGGEEDNPLKNRGDSLLKERKAKNASSGKFGGSQGSGTSSDILMPTDHGKRIRKTGGYMRAAPDDPASSEWGNPLHARSFISSTATSRMGSTSNLHEEDATDGGDPRSSGGGTGFLPPIVQPIHRPPPYNMDFMEPSFTRPWTFSYH